MNNGSNHLIIPEEGQMAFFRFIQWSLWSAHGMVVTQTVVTCARYINRQGLVVANGIMLFVLYKITFKVNLHIYSTL